MKIFKIVIVSILILFSSLALSKEQTYYINQNFDTPTISFRYYGIRHNMKLARKDCEDYARIFIENAKCGKLKSIFHDSANVIILTFELELK